MARPTVHVFTKLVDEPFFIVCTDNLKTLDGEQAGAITSIDTIRLEKRAGSDPETWEIVYDEDAFSSLQVLDDGSFTDAVVAGVLDADRDSDPEPGDGYMLVAECTVTLDAELGGGTVGKVFRRPVRIVAGALTAPAS